MKQSDLPSFECNDLCAQFSVITRLQRDRLHLYLAKQVLLESSAALV